MREVIYYICWSDGSDTEVTEEPCWN